MSPSAVLRSLTVAVLLLAGVVPPALAQAPTAPQEVLMYAPPAGWKISQGQASNNRTHLEYLPPGETPAAWSQRLVFHKFADMKDVKPKSYIDTFVQNIRPRCTRFGTSPPETQTEDGFASTWLFVLCLGAHEPAVPTADVEGLVVPTKAKHLILIKVFEGRDALYVLRKGWQSDDPKAKTPMEDTAYPDWGGDINAAFLCDLSTDKRCRK